jgi:hypothetical protein
MVDFISNLTSPADEKDWLDACRMPESAGWPSTAGVKGGFVKDNSMIFFVYTCHLCCKITQITICLVNA